MKSQDYQQPAARTSLAGGTSASLLTVLTLLLLVGTGRCSAGLIPLYHWYSAARHDHALSITWTPGSSAAASAGYTLVGEEGRIFSPGDPQPAGTVPLHIWFSPSRGDYFSSTEPVWRGGAGQTRSPDYRWVMLQGYVYAAVHEGAAPLYHWFNPAEGDNLETSDPRWVNTGIIPREGYEVGNIQGYLPSPAHWDLIKYQTGFRNQLDRGGCTMFSVTAAMEAAYRRNHPGDSNYMNLDLSEEFLNYSQKMFKLAPVYTPGASPRKAETALGPTDGGNGFENLRFLAINHVKLPRESVMPFHPRYTQIPAWNPWLTADLPFYPELDFSKPIFVDDQRMTDTVNLNPGLLPQRALTASEYYGVDGYGSLSNPRDVAEIESVLARNYEVIMDVGMIGDSWLVGGSPLPNQGGAGHSMLIVGYDRTDPANPYFILKNSWGATTVPGWGGFQRVSYEFIRRAAGVGCYITSVPSGPSAWPELQFLGRWNLDFDGWQGTLDIYHLPGMAKQQFIDAGVTATDSRLGTFFDREGNAFRVNGTVSGDTVHFYIDSGRPNPRWDQFGGRHFVYTLFRNGNRMEMAGFHTDPDGISYAGYARKEGAFLSGVTSSAALSPATYLGVWKLNFDGIEGRMEIRTRNDAGAGAGWAALQGQAIYSYRGLSYTKAVELKVALATPGVIQLKVPRPDGATYLFDGKMESWNRGVIAGPGTDPSFNRAAFYAYRTGDVDYGRFEFHQAFYNVNESAGEAVIRVDRLGGQTGAVSVDVAAQDRTALAGQDYRRTPLRLTFADGESTKTFSVLILNDTLNEDLESLSLELSNPVGGATLGGVTRANLDIIDDDVMPSLSVENLIVTEGEEGTQRPSFVVRLSAPSGRTVRFRANTVNGTALSGEDYVGISVPAAVIPPGETVAIVQVGITGRPGLEADETFGLHLTDVVNATYSGRDALCTIKELRILSYRLEGATQVITFPTANTGTRYYVEQTQQVVGAPDRWVALTPPEGLLGTGNVVTYRYPYSPALPRQFVRVRQE